MLRIRNKEIPNRRKDTVIEKYITTKEIFNDYNENIFKIKLDAKITELEDLKSQLNKTITYNQSLEENIKNLTLENKNLDADLSSVKNQNNSYENQINNSIDKIEAIEKELIILKKPINSIIYNQKNKLTPRPTPRKSSLIIPKKIEI
jgi:septal ring factor EnvC (AmiA/AmiB activator)